MTEEELANAARLMSESYDRMAESRDKFAEVVIGHTDMMKGTIERIRMFEDHLTLHLKSYDARLDFLKTIQDGLAALVPALSEANVNYHETNERLDKLMKKLETHFGSAAGLEFEN
ncbi:MAG: hypothetical protein H7Z16_08785 [Pyrinomonadaceae bacterium]|nr:hypothetical protein [Pyrinomonadaceae bacterium]